MEGDLEAFERGAGDKSNDGELCRAESEVDRCEGGFSLKDGTCVSIPLTYEG